MQIDNRITKVGAAAGNCNSISVTTSCQTIAKPHVICRFIFIVKRDDVVIEQRISDNEDYIKTEIFALKTLYSKYRNCSFWYGVLNGI